MVATTSWPYLHPEVPGVEGLGGDEPRLGGGGATLLRLPRPVQQVGGVREVREGGVRSQHYLRGGLLFRVLGTSKASSS